MTFAALLRCRRSQRARACLATLVGVVVLAPFANANAPVLRVKGFFCNSKQDYISFLTLQAKGENEEMAAAAVNKRIAKETCAYYVPADAVQTGEQTVIEKGLVFQLQSYLFLPEKVERWSGRVLDYIPQQGDDVDI